MRWVRPNVFCIAKTQLQPTAVVNWLRSLNVSDVAISRLLSDAKTDASKLVELCGRRCYLSFEPGLNPNVTVIREEIKKYIDNILDSGHGSVLEHVTFTFAVENVSRVFTGEMNRHRAGWAISEASMRFIRYNDIPIVETPSLRIDDKLTSSELQALDDERREIEEHAIYSEQKYANLVKINGPALNATGPGTFKKKKNITSRMRRIIPMGIATGGVWTGNLRALRHVFGMRCSEVAEEEIFEIASMILEGMQNSEPLLFGDFVKDDEGYWKPKYWKV